MRRRNAGTLLALAAVAPCAPALAQTSPPDAAAPRGVSIWELFAQSFDLFTILILVGSVVSVAIIVRSALTLRRSVVLPEASLQATRRLIAERRWADLQKFVAEDVGFVSRTLHEALPKLRGSAGNAREVTEIAAETETTRRFREVELLGVLGNLGPLLGLVGTVWGMIIAFTAIGETGGQAAASQLSVGIAKALFHTFLGLTLAIPSLLAFGIFRERLDRMCTEGTMLATDMVDAITASLAQPEERARPVPAGAAAS